MKSRLEVPFLIHLFGDPGLQFMDLGGGADTVLPPRAGSRSHLSSSEQAPEAHSHLIGEMR